VRPAIALATALAIARDEHWLGCRHVAATADARGADEHVRMATPRTHHPG
jgi:hypothetical protein